MSDTHAVAAGVRGCLADEQHLRCHPQTLWTYRQRLVRTRRQGSQRQSLGLRRLLLGSFPPALPAMLFSAVGGSPRGRKRSLTYRALHFPYTLKANPKFPVVQLPNPQRLRPVGAQTLPGRAK